MILGSTQIIFVVMNVRNFFGFHLIFNFFFSHIRNDFGFHLNFFPLKIFYSHVRNGFGFHSNYFMVMSEMILDSTLNILQSCQKWFCHFGEIFRVKRTSSVKDLHWLDCVFKKTKTKQNKKQKTNKLTPILCRTVSRRVLCFSHGCSPCGGETRNHLGVAAEMLAWQQAKSALRRSLLLAPTVASDAGHAPPRKRVDLCFYLWLN